jgi:hypothetical protein
MPPKAPPPSPRHLRPLFRKFLLLVHPDLFSDSPVISKQNEESLQIVLPFFNSLFSPPSAPSAPPDFQARSAGQVVTFHVKQSSNDASDDSSGSKHDGNSGVNVGLKTSAVRFTLHGHTAEAKMSSVTKLYVDALARRLDAASCSALAAPSHNSL